MRRAREIAFEKHLGRAEHRRVFSLCYMCMSSIKLETDVRRQTHKKSYNARTCDSMKTKQEKELLLTSELTIFLFKTPRHPFRVALMLIRAILWKIYSHAIRAFLYKHVCECSFGKGNKQVKKKRPGRQWIRQSAAGC
jgi:hypothetical protein